MALREYPYNREAAVAYADRWAFVRNPRYLDYSSMGGNCTNFASQCIYAGSGVMNYTPTHGWYYINGNNKSPSWTGVPYLYNFLINNRGAGPYGVLIEKEGVLPGDIAQLSFDGSVFRHSPVVVAVGEDLELSNILIAANTMDANLRPLDTYPFKNIRFIHIVGVRK